MFDSFKPPWLRRENTAGRAVWIIWCLFWAFIWLMAAAINHIDLYLVVLSLLAILAPIGKK
jgi:hypothetical protein